MDVAINYLAVLIAAAVIVGLGYLWYGRLFGKYWMKLKGYTPESMKTMKMSSRKSMALVILSAFVMAFVLALLVRLLNPIGVGGAFMLTLLIWTGFVATTMGNQVLFEDGSVKLYAFNAGYYFVALFLASLVLVLL